MNRKQAFAVLENECFCRVMPSTIHGVGIFAIRDISKGIELFKTIDFDQTHFFSHAKLKKLHPNVRKMICDYNLYTSIGVYLSPLDFQIIQYILPSFLNGSKDPNIELDPSNMKFKTVRAIKEGEELTCDYTANLEKTQFNYNIIY